MSFAPPLTHYLIYSLYNACFISQNEVLLLLTESLDESSFVYKKNAAMAVNPHRHVNNHIGKGSSIPEMRKLNPENRRAKKLHTPSAVAENRTGKKYWFAAKLILKQHVTPNLAIKKITKNQGDD